MFRNSIAVLLSACLLSCQSGQQGGSTPEAFSQGTFGYDLQFMEEYDKGLVTLKNGDAQLVLSPAFQGKVFTSTAKGLEGPGYGWINYDAISSGVVEPHINAYGGEDRLWLGPEGGQYSIYFAVGTDMVFQNWQTPAGIDSEPWDLKQATDTKAILSKELTLRNYSETNFSVLLEREVDLLSVSEMRELLGVTSGDGVQWVGFRSVNKLINKGKNPWDRDSGTLCLWVLGMFTPSDDCTVVIPYVEGEEAALGPIATTDYFGDIPADRIKIKDGLLYFKGDGKHRSKLGLSPKRAGSVLGSYDAARNVLTVVVYNKPEGDETYLNQVWGVQDNPYDGDAINSYNDGPLGDGDQMGPFYELETVSPAAFLDPEESLTHVHSTFHFEGDEEKLDAIAQQVFGVTLGGIKGVF